MIDVEAITLAHHEEWARVVASLTKRFGDLDIAEDAAAEAFDGRHCTELVRRTAYLSNPLGAWLTTTAYRKAIDRIRRENRRDDKQKEAQMLYDDPPEPLGAIEDERLRLIFTCCHPALAMEARMALTLRMVGGLTVPEIARAFLRVRITIGQRIGRAKAKIRRLSSLIPGAVRGGSSGTRLRCTRGSSSSSSTRAWRPVLVPIPYALISTAEAIRLLGPGPCPACRKHGEVAGLLALMLLTEARRTARISVSGELVTLDEQTAPGCAAVAEGHRLVRELPRPPG